MKHEIHVDLRAMVALVTGGASGIGEAIATALAANGATVAVHYNSSAKRAEELVASFRAAGGRAIAVRADVTDPASIRPMFDTVRAELGPVDILVNNAGTQIALATCEEMTLDLWNRAIALNLTSAMLCCQQVIGGMKQRGWGRIINISSISARSGGGPGGLSYASSKGGLATLTKGLAKELGPHGITVNAIAPGVILTAIHDKFSTKESLENLKKMTPLGRLGMPADIAGAVLFLASDSAAYVTGETISINGGLRMD